MSAWSCSEPTPSRHERPAMTVLCRLGAVGLLCALLPTQAFAELPLMGGRLPERQQVVIVVMGFVTWGDIEASKPPVLMGLIERGAVGMMTTVAGRPNTVSGAYLTLGAGARVAALGVRVGPVREAPLGAAAPVPKATAAQFDRMERLRELNRALHYLVPLGLLGDALEGKGLLAAAVGNADADASGRRAVQRREAAVIAMDGRGYVPLAFVGPGLVRREGGALVTDQAALAEAFDRAISKASLVVVDLGDTSRAHRRQASPQAFRQSLLRADATLGRLLPSVRWERTRMILLSPWARRSGEQPLAPIIVAGEGVEPGYLSSPSTRSKGLLCNVDLAPSVLSYLGLQPPAGLTGRGMTFVPDPSAGRAASLARSNRIYAQLSAGRMPTGLVLSVVQGLAMLLGLRYLWRRREGYGPAPGRWGLGLLVLPVGWQAGVVLGALPFPGEAPVWLRLAVPAAVALAVMLTYACGLLPGRRVVLWCTALTCLVLVVDQWFGPFVAGHSLLGHSPVVAGRFYGIGNELTSVLTGCALLALGLWCDAGRLGQWWRRAVAACALAAVVFTVGLPFWGANFGGVLTVATGLWTWWLLMTMPAPTGRRAVLLVAAVGATVFLCVGADLFVPQPAQTHLGRSVGLVAAQGGLTQLREIVLRKAEGNLRILLFTRWSVLFVVIFPFLVYSLLKPIRVLSDLFRGLPALGPVTKAVVYAGVVGMLFNDSGIAIPSIMLGAVVPASIGLALQGGQGDSSRTPEGAEVS